MKLIQALLFVTISISVAVTGCKKSSPSPSQQAQSTPTATPAASPAVAAKQLKPSTELTFSEMVPIKKFEVKAPASFSEDQIPTNGASEFALDAKAGQFLRVQVDEHAGHDPRDPYFSRLASQNAKGIKLASLDAEYCSDEQMYPIAEDGPVRVLFDPAGHKNAIQFSLLEQDDPLVTAGLKPEQISIDASSIGAGEPIKSTGYDRTCELGESWPASLTRNGKMTFRIAQVKGYQELFPKDTRMQLLASRLSPAAKPVDAKTLPYANWDGDAATVMTARQQMIEGEGWKGWRWIEGFSQDGDYPGSDLAYVFQGLTNDGRYFFRFRIVVTHPDVERLSPYSGNNSREREEDDTKSRLRLETALSSADPASFAPNLDKLDALVKSLKIAQ